jgi:hypothetical protein
MMMHSLQHCEQGIYYLSCACDWYWHFTTLGFLARFATNWPYDKHLIVQSCVMRFVVSQAGCAGDGAACCNACMSFLQ